MVFRIRLEPPKIITSYAMRDRLIPHALYEEIKARRKCKICGRRQRKKESFQIHHKLPVSEGGKHIHTNLILVCPECHKNLHEVIKMSEESHTFDNSFRKAIKEKRIERHEDDGLEEE